MSLSFNNQVASRQAAYHLEKSLNKSSAKTEHVRQQLERRRL
jgi:hypothetical protein